MSIIVFAGLKRILEKRRILKGNGDIQEELKSKKRRERKEEKRKRRKKRQSKRVIPQRRVLLKRDIILSDVYKMPAESFIEPHRAPFSRSEYGKPYLLQIGWILCYFWLYWDRMGNVFGLLCHPEFSGTRLFGSYAPHPISFQVMAIEVCDQRSIPSNNLEVMQNIESASGGKGGWNDKTTH